jgi:hypothetical protein
MPARKLSLIERRLQKRRDESRQRLAELNETAKNLFDSGQLAAAELRTRSGRLLAGVGLTGSLLLNSIIGPALTGPAITQSQTQPQREDFNAALQTKLSAVVPHKPTKLSDEQAAEIETVIYEQTGVVAKSQLEGQQLNYQVGYVGYEQHLQRFPGDRLELHDEELVAGIAPGLGGFGYFAKSREEFTTQDYMREKYYAVAQIHLLPELKTNTRFIIDWYKFRKILIVNPVNGQVVVTAMGDSGPGSSTGKQFGASPEAMKSIGLHKGPRKGMVVFLFVDDPGDKIPLGPLTAPIKK